MLALPLTVLGLVLQAYALPLSRRQEQEQPQPQCEAFSENFGPGTVADDGQPNDATQNAKFVATSPPGTFTTGTDNGTTLILKMQKPAEVSFVPDEHNNTIGTNTVNGLGATVNLTALTTYSKVSFEAKAPKVPGLVVGLILIGEGAGSGDEIDIELLPAFPNEWTTNMYATPPGQDPLRGVFGETHDFHGADGTTKGDVGEFHTYQIDYNAERIVWSVDGAEKRTLTKVDAGMLAKTNGIQQRQEVKPYYPSHDLRVQVALWDASSPNLGTAQWAGGPVKWDVIGDEPIELVIKNVALECVQ